MLARLDGKSLTEFVQNSDFKVSACRPVERNGVQVAEVAFEYNSQDVQGEKKSVAGSLYLDPERHWCVRGYKLTENRGSATGTRTLDVTSIEDSKSALLLPMRVVASNEWTFKDSKVNRQETSWTFHWVETPDALDDRAFTVSAFGLPEPFGSPTASPGRKWHLWAGAAGVFCLASAMLLRRFRTRKSMAPPGEPRG